MKSGKVAVGAVVGNSVTKTRRRFLRRSAAPKQSQDSKVITIFLGNFCSDVGPIRMEKGALRWAFGDGGC